MTRPAIRLAALGVVLLLAACAGEPQRVASGTSLADTLSRLGPPTGRYPLEGGGTRLQYSRQPMGYEVNDVDLDAAGRVLKVVQVLDERRFESDIQIGVWHQPDVTRHFGNPADTSQVSSFEGRIWTYRYLNQNSRRLLNVYIDPQGVVRRWDTMDEPFVTPDF